MFERHSLLLAIVASVVIIAATYAVGIPAGWSDGALGWAAIGGFLLGYSIHFVAEARKERRGR